MYISETNHAEESHASPVLITFNPFPMRYKTAVYNIRPVLSLLRLLCLVTHLYHSYIRHTVSLNWETRINMISHKITADISAIKCIRYFIPIQELSS